MDAIQFLKQGHQKANAAFAKVLRASPAARATSGPSCGPC
jgi:hypothetical protein